ncbi:glyoxylate carboligase [Streptomyces piniterrae]|uniref:Glyoxylate carboligase n=1 Tax=Streptomyces piniterrae TaxID=2571125 RepID=A0A4U0N7R2_9ACTN|nr:thiamine pyrophosphate-binding protein [Streptomyces piniterrae]TJZ49432.1 glyoxylate carboligase [Streptomyces piniterrae]
MAAQRVPAIQAAVQIMKDEGVDIAFGCPGAALLPLYAAMEEVGGIEHLSVPHEEGAAHMADGYARTSGNAGVAAVAAGPGAARLITGLYAARQDAVPLVCITGREGSGRRASGALRQEAGRPPDLIRLAGPVTKRAERIEDPARIPGAFREAFRIAREGRPGPVLIDVPADLAAAEIGYEAGLVPASGFRSSQAGTVRPPVAADEAAPAGGQVGAARWVLDEIKAIFGAATGAGTGPYLVTSSTGPYAGAVGESRRHRVHGRTGPPGWELPAAVGVRKALDSRGERTSEVIAVIDGRGFAFMAEELAVAAQYGVPFVLIMLTQNHRDDGFDDFTDRVKLVEAYGCAGRDVVDPAELRSAVEWARKEAVSTRRPVLVEVRAECAVPAPGGPPLGSPRGSVLGI